ncbi:MAG: type II toxin-antitoxin system HicB family antitoxin [Dysgonamonadaceae bacterium]|jgi:predicted HicB family RNase H-like nuclease|nr:type II toxin-antitoxin system HicB family antitoxin [Dysgonamonadaceae bacterium]
MGYLNYKGYKGSVEYSETDNCLFGSVLGMKKSCILYEGNTIDELKADFEAGVDSYLEHCERKGMKPDKPHSGTLNIRIPSEIHGKIAMISEKTGISINAFIRDSIEKRLEQVY